MDPQTTNHIDHQLVITVEAGGINNINYGTVNNYYGTPYQTVPQDESPLFSPEQEAVMQRAVEAGLQSRTEAGYHWNDRPVLLDYFLGRLLCGDKPQPRPNQPQHRLFWTQNSQAELPRERLNKLYNLTSIGKQRQQRLSGTPSCVPQGHDKVDSLFD